MQHPPQRATTVSAPPISAPPISAPPSAPPQHDLVTNDVGEVSEIVDVYVRPGCGSDYVALTKDYVTAARLQPGTICFGVYRVTDTPTSFIVVRTFADAAAKESHFKSALYREWWLATCHMLGRFNMVRDCVHI